MSNKTQATAIRGSSSGANAAVATAAAASAGGVTMSMRGPYPTTSYHEQQIPTVTYPVASSGRGFLPQPCRPILTYHHHSFGNARPPPPPLPPPTHFNPSLKGLPPSIHPKVALSPSSHTETKGYKHASEIYPALSRERTKDDSLVTVRDRMVRITEGASVYALCRSWLRNGLPEETQQPQYGDIIKSLPQPLPIPVTDNLVKDTEDEKGQEEEDKTEDEQSIENLSAKDLLKRHIDRARKVRSRLRQQRLKRIARYKTRLALLLPPPVEQFRSDAAAGN